MAITNLSVPSNVPTHAVPYDYDQAFSLAQTVTASAWLGNQQTQITMGPGRMEGYWVLDIAALALGSSNETYQFFLCGSNDPNFGNGNVELLAMHDFAPTSALRVLPTILGVSPSDPQTGLNATRHVIPFSNLMGYNLFEYLQLYALIAGTSPSVTLSSWLAPFTGMSNG